VYLFLNLLALQAAGGAESYVEHSGFVFVTYRVLISTGKSAIPNFYSGVYEYVLLEPSF
jgi:hypothetical protein